MQGIFDHDRVDDLIRAGAEQADDERPKLRVLAAGAAPAEPARTERGLLTGPAVHTTHLWQNAQVSRARVHRSGARKAGGAVALRTGSK